MPNGDGGWVLPAVIDPPERFCFQIEVPNERQHIAAFVGALWELQYWFNWQRDDAHTGALVANVWRSILNQAIDQMNAGFSCNDVVPIVIVDTEVDLTQPCDFIRWDENGVLQVLCCGEWTDVPGTENIPASGMRQPEGQPRPAAAQCKQYEVSLSAGQRWIIPFGVLPDDVITVSNVQGIWSDAAGVFWYYPNGNLYVLGGSVPTCDHKIGDQLGAACHMRLLGQLAEPDEYVDMYNATYTVPAAPGSRPFLFLANNGFPGATGTITFHVEVCSGATPPTEEWCYDFDFTASSFGAWWHIAEDESGVYASGVGYTSEFDPIHGENIVLLRGNLPTISGEYTSMEFWLTSTDTATVTYLYKSGGSEEHPALVAGDNHWIYSGALGQPLEMNAQGQGAGDYTIYRAKITGTGANPFGESNC